MVRLPESRGTRMAEAAAEMLSVDTDIAAHTPVSNTLASGAGSAFGVAGIPVNLGFWPRGGLSDLQWDFSDSLSLSRRTWATAPFAFSATFLKAVFHSSRERAPSLFVSIMEKMSMASWYAA